MSSLPSFVWGEGGKAAPYLTFGLPSDPVAWSALAGACVALGVALLAKPRLKRLPTWVTLSALAVLSCALSSAYLVYYLRGGPRIIDATSYFLEGRALATGQVWFDVPGPRASFHGRFLLASEQGLAALFPPGFPLLLALGFLAGAPLAVGPLLAALLVPATFAAARALGATRTTAYAAAALGILSAALRYHTADTMSHGLAALLVTTAFAASVRASSRSAALAGAAAGLLVATRPVTGVIVLALGAFGVRRGARSWIAYAAGAAPFIAFFVWHQHTLTGEWLRSGQSAYYAVADGPAGCFRYGFGPGIGCWFEHGEYVRARMPHGYGLAEALSNTLRRLALHTSDLANFAPLAALVPLGAFCVRGLRSGRLATLVITCVILGYAPFYFEGSYPGGGARFFADVLPLEHALLAIAAAKLGRVPLLWPLALLGFALHTSHQHGALSRREGGRPMFEAHELRARGIDRGLVFVNTDHGFSLGHDPSVRDAASGIVVARARNDALDRMLWERLGRPESHLYRYDASGSERPPSVVPFVPASTERVEGESLYPPFRAESGFAHPEVRQGPCISGRGVLRFQAAGGPPAKITVLVPARAAYYHLRIGWSDDSGQPAAVRAWAKGRELPIRWSQATPCRTGVVALSLADSPLGTALVLEASGGGLDYVEPVPDAATEPAVREPTP